MSRWRWRRPLRVGSRRGGTKAMLTAAGVLDGAELAIGWSEFAAAQLLPEAIAAGAAVLHDRARAGRCPRHPAVIRDQDRVLADFARGGVVCPRRPVTDAYGLSFEADRRA